MKSQSNQFLEKFKAKNLAYIEPVSTCAEDDFYFEPLSGVSSEYLIHFTRMMEDYTVAGEDNDQKK